MKEIHEKKYVIRMSDEAFKFRRSIILHNRRVLRK